MLVLSFELKLIMHNVLGASLKNGSRDGFMERGLKITGHKFRYCELRRAFCLVRVFHLVN